MKKIIIATLLLSVVVIASCAPPNGTAPEQPEPYEGACGIENCHGLKIECGSDVSDFCTQVYIVGDFCRDFAICEVVGNKCQNVVTPEFTKCKACVRECGSLSGDDAFKCEDDCRELF